ncbi:hypothetical protein SERLA73DRAFT_17442, partial [Serpula lacrymans var. lacrymans S7.3]
IHPVFNEAILSPYHAPKFLNQPISSRPPPEIVEGIDEYEVESIIASRPTKLKGSKLDYLIHWHGYPVSERT